MGKGSKSRKAVLDQEAKLRSQTCNWCQKHPEGSDPFKLCKGCKQIRYCSDECQRIDWQGGGHREKCAGGSKKRADEPSADVQAAMIEALKQVTGKLTLGPGDVNYQTIEHAQEHLQATNPLLYQRMVMQSMMNDEKVKYEDPDSASHKRCIAVLVQRLDTKLQQLPDGKAAGDDLFTRELAVLSHYCFSDEFMHTSYNEGAVDFMRKIIEAPAGTLDAVQTSLAWYGVGEPSMHDGVRGKMLGAGYLDWALARLRLPDSTKKLLQAQGVDLATPMTHADNQTLPQQDHQQLLQLSSKALKRLQSQSQQELVPMFQAARLVTELVKDGAARKAALQEGGLVELLADVLVVSEQPPLLLLHKAAKAGRVEVVQHKQTLAYPPVRCLALCAAMAQDAAAQEQLLARMVELDVPAKLRRGLAAATPSELTSYIAGPANSIIDACVRYQRRAQMAAGAAGAVQR